MDLKVGNTLFLNLSKNDTRNYWLTCFVQYYSAMPRLVCCIVFIFCSATLSARPPLRFTGSISVNGDKTYAYALYFNDVKGIISGYSLTNVDGLGEIRTSISGKVDPVGNTFTFREEKLLEAKTGQAAENICYITTTLSATIKSGRHVLKGNFTGYAYDRKTVCARGEVIFYAPEEVFSKIFPVAEKEERTETDTKSRPGVVDIEPGKAVSISSHASSAHIELWDDTIEDGDRVTLLQNGKKVLENYMLRSAHKEIDLPLTGRDTLTIIAESEGAAPPNTAALSITTGGRTYDYRATTTMQQPVYIILNKKD